MQLIPRYLVDNRTTLISNEAGFITEYRKVYTRQLQVYKGIDNVLQFKLLNADQKPVDLANYTPKFQAFDEAKQMIVQHDGVQVTSDGSTPIKGLFKVTVTSNDLLNVKEQFLSYSIHLIDANQEAVITYVDPHFENNGSIKVSAEAFPGPTDSYSVSTFTMVTEDTPYWISETVTAQPGINGNEALHTASVYTDSYVGNVVVQATLDNQIMGDTIWADIDTLTLTGNETEPSPINFNGVFSHLRFKATADPANKISKVLVRN